MSNLTKRYTDSQLSEAGIRADNALKVFDRQAIADEDSRIIHFNIEVAKAGANDDEQIGLSVGIRVGLALAEIFAEEENQRVDPCTAEVFSSEDGKRLRNKLPSLSRYD